MKRLLGFTLTELMVAITVLGVLTAAVLPAILGNNPNQNKMMMKKAYYVTAEVVSDMINDDTLYPTLDANGYEYTGYGALRNTVAATYDSSEFSGATKFQNIFARTISPKVGCKSSLSTAEKAIGNTLKTNTTNATGYCLVESKDGMHWWILPTSDWNKVATILVDVNGSAKPNCYQGTNGGCSSRSDNFDRFRMVVYSDGAILINDADVWAKDAITVGSSLTD